MAGYRLVIGTCNWSSWSLRPYLALAATGQAFELVKIALRQTNTKSEILRYSPSGKVPLLAREDDDAHVFSVWDSLAICETLAERHPEARLWPSDPTARALARSYACEMHAGFPDLREQLSMDFVRRKPMPELREETQDQIARILSAWQEGLTRFGGPFLFGAFSVADCMYAPVVSRFLTYGVTVPSLIASYMDKIFALPAMGEWGRLAQAEVESGQLDCKRPLL